MAHRRGGFRGRGISESQRRKKAWVSVKTALGAVAQDNALFQTSINITTAAAGTATGTHTEASLILVSDTEPGVGEEASTLPEECTILRSRGSLTFPKNNIADGSPVGSILEQYVFGFGILDIRSLTQGIFPGPIIDSDWDGWMFLRQSGVAPVDSEGTVVDVKAMRKIKTGDALFFAAQHVHGGGTASTAKVFNFDMRLLILLP